MRHRTEILDILIREVIDFQRKYHKPVRKIVLPLGFYKSLLYELNEEGLNTIYGTELRPSVKARSIILS